MIAAEPSSGTMPGGLTDPAPDDMAGVALRLARVLSAGATMWCCAPSWPHHAQHLAVEFVHPVVVGTRALPAVAVAEHDPATAVRAGARAGDALVVVAAGDDEVAHDLLARAEAWGLHRLWIGAGRRPDPGAAEDVLWLEDEATRANFAGGIVRTYHVLWELTQVCLEHPGLLQVPEDCVDDVCITCADEGRVAEVVSRQQQSSAVTVRTANGLEVVDASLVDDVSMGDLLLVHAGTAIARVKTPGRSCDE